MKQYMTGREVAKRLGVAPATLRAWRCRGGGPPFSQQAGKGTQAIYDPDIIEWFATQVWPTRRRRGGRNEQGKTDSQ
jgi:predicted site-specific integrase-resolvase